MPASRPEGPSIKNLLLESVNLVESMLHYIVKKSKLIVIGEVGKAIFKMRALTVSFSLFNDERKEQ